MKSISKVSIKLYIIFTERNLVQNKSHHKDIHVSYLEIRRKLFALLMIIFNRLFLTDAGTDYENIKPIPIPIIFAA